MEVETLSTVDEIDSQCSETVSLRVPRLPARQRKYDDKRRSNNTTKLLTTPTTKPLLSRSHRGVSTLYKARSRRNTTYPTDKPLPLINFKTNTKLLEQIMIVIAITTLITLHNNTEAYFRNIQGAFKAIFESSEYNLQRTDVLMSDIETQLETYFHLHERYIDHYMYPTSTRNTSDHTVATLQFISLYTGTTVSYTVNQYNYSMVNDSQFVHLIQDGHYIDLYFNIESYSFYHGIRTKWAWYLHYSYNIDDTAQRVVPHLFTTYSRLGTNIWDHSSFGFICLVVASLGLITFSVLALLRFVYIHRRCCIWKWQLLLPVSHCVCIICGTIYLLKMYQVYNLSDEWQLRLLLAVTALFSWCMLSYTLNTKEATQYGALLTTVQISFKPILNVLISTLPIVIGYILFGKLLFGIPRHGTGGEQMFSTAEVTAKTLFSMLIGDDIYNSFDRVGFGNVVGEFYVYSWCILFIAVIFNVFISIVEEQFFIMMPSLESSPPPESHDKSNEKRDVDFTLEWQLKEVKRKPLDMDGVGIQIELTNIKHKATRNEMYINSFVSHLNRQIMGKITRQTTARMMQTDVRNQMHSESDWEHLESEISGHYKTYLKHVSAQINAFVS